MLQGWRVGLDKDTQRERERELRGPKVIGGRDAFTSHRVTECNELLFAEQCREVLPGQAGRTDLPLVQSLATPPPPPPARKTEVERRRREKKERRGVPSDSRVHGYVYAYIVY